jgi:inhibitor of cysteine peptidase
MTTTPTSSSNSVTTIPVNSTSNGDILTIPASDRVLVTLAENPTTGYMWNATVSKGLSVVSDLYIAPNSTLIGAGGYHQWILAPDTAGTYTFKAVYIRPWEGTSSAADSFSLVIEATPK